jgi:hypothetical protein
MAVGLPVGAKIHRQIAPSSGPLADVDRQFPQAFNAQARVDQDCYQAANGPRPVVFRMWRQGGAVGVGFNRLRFPRVWAKNRVRDLQLAVHLVDETPVGVDFDNE